ncbi:MAG: D-alanine--D-alanine ligase [Chloroflexi bacterium]|nr:D-alanine--D-alanine ligase [Chloroflexota bacterium]
MPSKLRVGVLFGGRSDEHEVSLISVQSILQAMDKARYEIVHIGIDKNGRWLFGEDALPRLLRGELADEDAPRWPRPEHLAGLDVLFPVLHGPYGEDGSLQGLLELADIPYVGCGVLASALAMDKVAAKMMFAAYGLPQTPWRPLLRRDWRRFPEATIAHLEASLTYPMFVKPANLGSSVGVTKAHDRDELVSGLTLASKYDRKLVVEQAVPNVREIEISILGNEDPQASIPGEIVPSNEFYDYAAKYLDGASREIIPAPLSPEQQAAIQRMALDAFRAIDGRGMARVDFLLDDVAGEIFLNEVNTIPGFTSISMYPKLWLASGLSYPQLIDRLIELALER